MLFSRPKFFTSFAALNIAQFFSALNDNIFKLLLVFLLITIKGPEHSNTILSLAGAIFVVPFLLFASLAGTLADRFSKRSIIYFTRLLEILIMSLGVIAIAFKNGVAGYTVLFLMATQSAIFSPAKYGIIPEIVKPREISRCNGILTATTYLAIILGTFLASFLSDITHKNFSLATFMCVLIALIGTAVSLGIEKTSPQAAKKKVSAHFIRDIYRTLKRAHKTRYLLLTILFGTFFLFMGAYTQLNIIPFAMQSLHLSEIQGGYLFLMTAIGIGLGAFLAGRLSGREVELGFVPLTTFGITTVLILLYVFQSYFYVVIPLLIFLGIFGGFFVVPIDAYIQIASPNVDRGQNVAAANFLGFIGVMVASGLIAFLGNVLDLTAAQGFLIVGLIGFVTGFALLLLMSDQVLRLLVAKASYLFWDLKVVGRKHLRLSPPILLVGERTSWLDTLVVMATLPRLLRYIVPLQGDKLRRKNFFYKLLRFIPVDIEHLAPVGTDALMKVERELSRGHSVCLMHPASVTTATLQEWETQLKKHLRDTQIPVLPIHISRQPPKEGAGYFAQLWTLFRQPLIVTYGAKKEF